MAVDMRARYFGAPEEAFMFDEGAMSPSFSVLPQYELPNNNFMVMPPAAAPYAEQQYLPAVQPMTQEAVAPYVEPYQYTPAVQPMTQEAAAPYDLSGLDLSSLAGLDLSGLNFGTDFGGGAMGGQYQPDPNVQYIGAPLSNKGNPTSQTGGNTFAVKVDQPVRLVDHRTNQVVFEGTGFDAARKATELGQSLTDQFGRKANYSIQTADPTGAFNTVAYEKKNKSTLGTIANVAGTALPLAMIPLTMGMSAPLATLSTAGKIALGAGVGGLSSGLKGQNVLKGAAIGGLSAAGGSLLPKIPAVGDLGRLAQPLGVGVGSTVGNLATGQNLKNSLLSGVASGTLAYLTPDIQAALRGAQGSGLSVGGDTSVGTNSGPAPIATVTGSGVLSSPVLTGGNSSSPRQVIEERPAATVTGNPAVPGAVIGYTGGSGGEITPEYLPRDTSAEERPAATVTGNPAVPGAVIGYTGGSGGEITPEYLPREEILVKARPPYTPTAQITGGLNLSQDLLTDVDKGSEAERKAEEERKKLDASDYLRLASLAAGLIGSGGGGGGGGGTPGSQAINPIFSAKLPTPGAGGAFKVGGLDYTTPPARSAADMYRYAMGPAMDIPAGMDLRGATSPYAGYGPGTLGEETFKRVTGMAHGGAMGYARGSSRDSFAVEGPGTGRSDDIPAVLSDGEYVIDAETVALLGDGSSKAGAKKLDEMRVKVRKHKGRNLAKGKFSVNAKRPEKYLSGGRT
jgi:hypothetical protein